MHPEFQAIARTVKRPIDLIFDALGRALQIMPQKNRPLVKILIVC